MSIARSERAVHARFSPTRRAFVASILCGAATFCAPGCSTFSRLTSKAPVADTGKIDDATSQVESELERLANASKKERPTVCFLGVSGAGAESFSVAARDRLEDCGKISVVSKSKMQDALKKSGVKANDVFIPIKQKKFVEELGESVDYIVAGYVEKVPLDESDDSKGKKDVFRLDVVEVGSSKKSSVVVDL